MKRNHIKWLFRMLSALLCLYTVLTVLSAPLIVSAAVTPGVRFSLKRTDADGTAVADGNPVLSCTVQAKGEGLMRTQFVSLAYDREALILCAQDGTSVSVPEKTALTPLDADGIVSCVNGWGHTLLPPYHAVSADWKTGYLLLYPDRETPVSGNAFSDVCTVRFAVTGKTLSKDDLRLPTYEEQRTLGQSVKLALCTADTVMTYGSWAGGDTLPDAVFYGDTVISGAREDGAPTENVPWTNPFHDVSDDAGYYDAVSYVCRAGLFIGTGAAAFEPDGAMTRATFATVLCRLAGEEERAVADAKGKRSSFSDVKENTWYLPYILWAEKNGLFYGDGAGHFMPEQKITNEQMYLLMERFAKEHGYAVRAYENVSVSSVSDADAVSAWALSGVRFAFANGLLVADGSFAIRPKENAKRWALAELLYEFSGLTGQN